jgi:ABC-2 type transport system permease protein
MTALTLSAGLTTHAAEPRPRFRDLLAAEWIKLWSLRSTYGSLALITVSVIGFSVNAALADYNNWPTYSADRRALFNPLRDAFPEQAYLFVMLAASSIGAVTIVGEYTSGLIRTTFAAVPERRSVVAAKIAVVIAVMSIVGAIAAVTSFGVSQAILSGRYAEYTIGDPYAWRAIAASALLAPVSALVGIGIGAVIRHTAPTIVAVGVVLLLLPSFVNDDRRSTAAIHHALPLSAWQRLVDIHPDLLHQSHYPGTITGAWIVYAVWPITAAIVAVIVVHRRDP